eukprot:218692-Alexandrium_andersonii.AAC.1
MPPPGAGRRPTSTGAVAVQRGRRLPRGEVRRRDWAPRGHPVRARAAPREGRSRRRGERAALAVLIIQGP